MNFFKKNIIIISVFCILCFNNFNSSKKPIPTDASMKNSIDSLKKQNKNIENENNKLNISLKQIESEVRQKIPNGDVLKSLETTPEFNDLKTKYLTLHNKIDSNNGLIVQNNRAIETYNSAITKK